MRKVWHKSRERLVLTAVLLGFATAGIGLMGTVSTLKAGNTDQVFVFPIVNQDQLQGKWKQFKGELKRKWGKFTDDDLLEIEGRYDKLEGKIQELYGDQRDEVKRWVDKWFEAHDGNHTSTKQ